MFHYLLSQILLFDTNLFFFFFSFLHPSSFDVFQVRPDPFIDLELDF